MEKLVITYSRCKEYAASWDMVECIEYSSLKQFLDDLEVYCATNTERSIFAGEGFLGTDVCADVVYAKDGYDSFQVRTLEQWFEDEKVVDRRA